MPDFVNCIICRPADWHTKYHQGSYGPAIVCEECELGYLLDVIEKTRENLSWYLSKDNSFSAGRYARIIFRYGRRVQSIMDKANAVYNASTS